jgi:hypothetical protein
MVECSLPFPGSELPPEPLDAALYQTEIDSGSAVTTHPEHHTRPAPPLPSPPHLHTRIFLVLINVNEICSELASLMESVPGICAHMGQGAGVGAEINSCAARLDLIRLR